MAEEAAARTRPAAEPKAAPASRTKRAAGTPKAPEGSAGPKPPAKPKGSTARPASTASPASTAEAQPGSVEQAWGQGLAAYPAWIEPYLPGLHQSFNVMNKYVSVPALRAGLGKFMSTPVTGYLMILRTRGRKSGEMRDAPLGYVVVGDAVYCLAGFGEKTHWLQNVKADARVEVILPSRSFSGRAEEVTDPAERRRILPVLLKSMGVVAAGMGMGNPWKMGPDDIEAKCEGLPLVRVRATGIAAGPEDPGGWYWTVPIVASVLLLVLWLRGRSRKCSRCR